MRPSSLARRYAEAVFDVAQEQGEVPAWLDGLRNAAEALKAPGTAQYFRDPNVSQEDKLATIDRAFQGTKGELLNLLHMLVLRGRLLLLPSILQEVESLDREARGVLEATATVARPLTDADRDGIARRLAAATGKQVELETHVDPSILGGVIIQIGDRLIDASVSGRLERLRHALAI